MSFNRTGVFGHGDFYIFLKGGDLLLKVKFFVERKRYLNMELLLFISISATLYFICSYVEHVGSAVSDGTLHTGLPTYEYLELLSNFRLKIAIIFLLISLLLIIGFGMPVPSI